MSDKLNDGGPAFPIPWPDGPFDKGMSTRDFFAAAALTGLLASESGWKGAILLDNAVMAYECADAMLKAREEKS